MPSDKLCFFSRSAGVKPGKGAGEVVVDPSKYVELSKFKEWRKALSNFHVCPFEYKGNWYRTIEHGFQAKKIAIADPVAATQFTMGSGSALGLGTGLDAQRQRKIVKLTKDQLKIWDAKKDRVMGRLAVKKYLACSEARDILKATGTAELWHIVMRSKPIRFTHLEKIRERL